jgi:hypothetical protein
MASSTVLAWCQKELELFIDLSFIPPITDLSYPLWSNGKALLCLAHRYYPTNIPDFAHQLVQPNTLLFATDLFQLKLGELPQPEQGIATYVETLHSHLDIAHSPIDTNLNEEFMSKAKRLQSQLDDFYTHLMECRDDESKEPANSRDFAGLEESQQSVRSYINSLSSDIVEHPSISALISSIEATEAAISLQTNKSGITSPSTSSVAAQIRNELEFIQAKMLKTTTTDPGIQDLEERAEHAGKMLETLENKEQYDALFEKYQLIVSWVDDVRVWFVEAERIRNWIEERIQLLESKPALDALYDVEIEYTLEQVERLNQDQVALENEVEVFDKQDMSRLRAHVKALTGTERGNKDLSPADTTTIEITFTTLMTLDRLMHLMRRRAYELQMLALRMYWEIEYEKTVSWVRSTTENVKSFVKHKARWQPDTADENTKTDIINALVEFEQQCMAFDQGQFTTTVNMYQDLDDACKVELPTHLESRQVAIEEAFEELTNRIAFARQVVEQHLVLADFLNHADQLKNEGEQLRQEINKAEQLCLPGKEFTERVGLFQENAIRVATTVASRVPYPETTHPADQEENEDANQVIRTVIGARKSALILFGEALDQSLSAHRRALQLQKRAKQLQDDVNRLSGLMDERIRTVEKSKIDVFVGKCGLDETDLSRLNKERDGQVSRMNSIRENDMKKLVDNIKSLETACQSSQIQVNSVITGMDSIEQQLVKLDESLQKHSSELEVLGKRISWESQHAKSAQWVTAMTGTLWDFVSHRAQWRPRYEFSGVPDWKSIWEDFNAMKQKVELFHDEQLKPTDDIFSHLVAGFGIILGRNSPLLTKEDSITPEHVQRRQDSLDQSFSNLLDLLEYTQGVIEQHEALTLYSQQATVLDSQGQNLLSELQQAIRTIDTSQKGDLEERLHHFSQQVLEFWANKGKYLYIYIYV